MISLSDEAVSELKRIISDTDECDEEGSYLRVSIEGGGCSGFQYKLGFIKQAGYDTEQDSKYEQDGITVVVDRKSSLYVDGTIIDYYDNVYQKGFVFNNPNANKTCGCGSSFSA